MDRGLEVFSVWARGRHDWNRFHVFLVLNNPFTTLQTDDSDLQTPLCLT